MKHTILILALTASLTLAQITPSTERVTQEDVAASFDNAIKKYELQILSLIIQESELGTESEYVELALNSAPSDLTAEQKKETEERARTFHKEALERIMSQDKTYRKKIRRLTKTLKSL